MERRSTSRGPHPERCAAPLDQSGFSIIEVVIAMLVLGLMSLSLLPLFIGTMKVSVVNRSLVTATAIANDRIAEVRAGFRDDVPTPCSALASYVDPEGSYVVGPLGSGLVSHRKTTSGCLTDAFHTVGISVSVFDETNLTKALVTVSTEVLVSAG